MYTHAHIKKVHKQNIMVVNIKIMMLLLIIPYLQMKVPWSAIQSPLPHPASQYESGASRSGSESGGKSVPILMILLLSNGIYTHPTRHIKYTNPMAVMHTYKLCSLCAHWLAICQNTRDRCPIRADTQGKQNRNYAPTHPKIKRIVIPKAIAGCAHYFH